ncbi:MULTISPECIES: histidine kinase [unclassified Nonomuraea]|uniref:sensor histidine kinase n=1 Tax=unclassified Nonomuraea TaxID=2593643 RepID=UPI0033DDA502
MTRRHRLAVDVAIAVALAALDTVLTLVHGSWWPERPGTPAWVLLGAQALACLSLVARRRAPLAVLAVIGAFTLVVTLLIWPLGAITPANPDNVWAPVSAASLAAYGPLYHSGQNRRKAILALAVFTLIVVRLWQPSVLLLTLGVLRVALGPLLALYFDARRRLVQALTERAERAERERHLLAEQARTEERARLAGEMHDVVTHRVSLMVLQAGALRMTATDEETRRQAEELRVAGVQALDELRDLVGILRTAPEGEETPSVAGFAALVAESTVVGNPAELVEEGDPALASPVVGRTAYRIVREGLTNVRKHAPGARVTVRVEYGDAQVRLSIRNTPPTRAPGELAGTGSGLGIAGLRQRIEVVHGTLRAGREPDGGFRLEATLPAYVPTGV